jgi:hypothetical protein
MLLEQYLELLPNTIIYGYLGALLFDITLLLGHNILMAWPNGYGDNKVDYYGHYEININGGLLDL